MDSDSDEDLPSLSAIASRLQREKPAVTKVSKQQSPVKDPAEEAIVPKTKVKLRSKAVWPSSSFSQNKASGATVSTTLFFTSDTSNASDKHAIAGGRSKARKTTSISSASKGDLDVSSSTALLSDVQPTEIRQSVGVAAKCQPTNPANGARVANPQNGNATSTELTGCQNSQTRKHIHGSESSDAPRNLTAFPILPSTSCCLDRDNSSASTWTLPTTPKHAKAAEKARKQRRITIITISDSEDEANLPSLPARSRSPSRTPSLVGEGPSEAPDELQEDVSFADYSENEDSDAGATAKKPEGTRRIIEIDSSDSEYDAAAGVITWNPTPNKVKNIVKPSTLLLSTIPLSATGNTPSRKHITEKDLLPPSPAFSVGNGRSGQSESSSSKLLPQHVASPGEKPVSAVLTPHTAKRKDPFLKQRDRLAMDLIEELSVSVFQNQLPEDLTVVWNGRLNTTAGRANWKKITNKSTNTTIHRAEIELSVKVVDSEEKLRCTLAHELCHIAAWAIDKEMKPAHGPAFKSWGRKIMRARQDIKVTTKHTYEIAYKYRWQCTVSACGKTYGRHSNSIDPKRHACGACSGRLVRLDKHGQPIAAKTGADGTPRKESEWALFSKATFRRIKSEQPSLTMTQINKLVAAEWADVKAKKAQAVAGPSLLARELGELVL